MQVETTIVQTFESSPTSSIEADDVMQQPVLYRGHRVCRCPKHTKLELHQSLKPALKDIYENIEKGHSWRRLTPIILKNVLLEIKEMPFMTALKCGAIFICSYMLKNLLEGIIGGEVLFSNFYLTENMFSSDSNTAVNGAGFITNAAADVNFTIDAIVICFGGYKLLIEDPINKAKCAVISDSFDEYLEGEKGMFLSDDERNELYKLKYQELARYGYVPYHQRKIPSVLVHKLEDIGEKEAAIEEDSVDAEV
jgi:hypothetical protein